MSYLKDLSKKSSSPLSTSTQNTYSDPREKNHSRSIKNHPYFRLCCFSFLSYLSDRNVYTQANSL